MTPQHQGGQIVLSDRLLENVQVRGAEDQERAMALDTARRLDGFGVAIIDADAMLFDAVRFLPGGRRDIGSGAPEKDDFYLRGAIAARSSPMLLATSHMVSQPHPVHRAAAQYNATGGSNGFRPVPEGHPVPRGVVAPQPSFPSPVARG